MNFSNDENDQTGQQIPNTERQEANINRKFIIFLQRTLNSKRNLPYQELLRECVEILRNSNLDILNIKDSDRNNCK